jgi:hypothetical protein
LAWDNSDIAPDYETRLLELYKEVTSKYSPTFPIPDAKELLLPYADQHLQQYYILQKPDDISMLLDPDII